MPALCLSLTTMEVTTAVRDTDALCVKIVDAIADHVDTDPVAMTPLGYVLDPEALDALVSTAADVEVSFTYDDHTVVVDADERVTVDGDEYDCTDGDAR